LNFRFVTTLLISILAALLSQMLTAHAGEQIEIKVLPYTRVTKLEKIRLIDIVAHENLTDDQVREFSKIELGDAPRLGEQRIFTNKIIADAIRQNVIQRQWALQIPHQVIVENRGYEISEETVRQELNSRWQTLCADCRLEIKNIQLPIISSEYANTPWFLEYEEKMPRGHFAQKLIMTKADGKPAIYWVNGQLEIRRKVPVLNRSVSAATRLTNEDFTLDWRDVTFATDSAPTPKEIIGQETKYMLNNGDIIWRGALVREKAVQRGEIVRVITGDDVWNISMQAKTEQDGFVGDIVNVRNLQTNKLISGRVVGRGEIEVQ
jgi:flagellar basal body P-ring formation protein FlgA